MGIDLSKIRNENARLKNPGGSNSNFLENFIKMPEGEGTITVRILPPLDGHDMPYSVTRTHRLGDKNFHCLCALVGDRWEGRCPVCEYYRYLWRESDGANDLTLKNKLISEARGIKPVERFYYNAVERATSKAKILSIGKQLHHLIMLQIAGDPDDPNDPGFGDVTEFETGRDLKIKKALTKGSEGSYPSYTGSKFLGESVAGTAADWALWLAARHDLFALRQLKTDAELRKEIRIFRGMEKDPRTSFDVGEFETPAAPQPTATVRSTVTTVKPPMVNDVDESLPDDDFMAELRNM